MQKKKVIIMHPGESRTAVITIHSIKNEKFSAEYSLIYMKDKAEESTGVCNIKEHDIEALISPQKRGTYTLDIRYAVLDEILIEHIEVKVV
jgi:hypothetical protein